MIKDIPAYVDPEPYCKLGDKREPHQPEGVWELRISDFLSTINPKDYFVTSGEAVQKSKKLEQDVWEMAGRVRKLYNLLKKARGPAVYLETEWVEGGRLIIKRKNPRNKNKKAQNDKAHMKAHTRAPYGK
jgi:hypothetical protein